MHICISNLTIIGSDNGLSPGRRQAIICTNAGILLFRTSETNLREILLQNSYIFIQENALENVVWIMATILSQPQCVKIISQKTVNPCQTYIMFPAMQDSHSC